MASLLDPPQMSGLRYFHLFTRSPKWDEAVAQSLLRIASLAFASASAASLGVYVASATGNRSSEEGAEAPAETPTARLGAGRGPQCPGPIISSASKVLSACRSSALTKLEGA